MKRDFSETSIGIFVVAAFVAAVLFIVACVVSGIFTALAPLAWVYVMLPSMYVMSAAFGGLFVVLMVEGRNR